MNTALALSQKKTAHELCPHLVLCPEGPLIPPLPEILVPVPLPVSVPVAIPDSVSGVVSVIALVVIVVIIIVIPPVAIVLHRSIVKCRHRHVEA